jgi:hypothetical protein
VDFAERRWGGIRAAGSALFRFFGTFGLLFQADHPSQPGPNKPGQVTGFLPGASRRDGRMSTTIKT